MRRQGLSLVSVLDPAQGYTPDAWSKYRPLLHDQPLAIQRLVVKLGREPDLSFSRRIHNDQAASSPLYYRGPPCPKPALGPHR